MIKATLQELRWGLKLNNVTLPITKIRDVSAATQFVNESGRKRQVIVQSKFVLRWKKLKNIALLPSFLDSFSLTGTLFSSDKLT